MLFRFKDYLRGTLHYPTKTIGGIWTGVAKRLRRIYLNDSGFQKQSKKNSANLAERNNKHKGIVLKFQWPQEGLNCESLACEVVT